MQIIQDLLNQVDTLSKLSSSAGGITGGGSSTRMSRNQNRGDQKKREETQTLVHFENRHNDFIDNMVQDDEDDSNVDDGVDSNENGSENEILVSFDKFFAKSGKISPLTIEKEDDNEII